MLPSLSTLEAIAYYLTSKADTDSDSDADSKELPLWPQELFSSGSEPERRILPGLHGQSRDFGA
jgi:hypothetical protein